MSFYKKKNTLKACHSLNVYISDDIIECVVKFEHESPYI